MTQFNFTLCCWTHILFKSVCPRMTALKESTIHVIVLYCRTQWWGFFRIFPLTVLSHQFSSVQFSRSVVSDSLRPHESQHTRPPCPSPTPGVHSNSYPSSRWCHPTISSSVFPFSSRLQSFPASGSFPMSFEPYPCNNRNKLTVVQSYPKFQMPSNLVGTIWVRVRITGLPWQLSGKESTCQCRRYGFNPSQEDPLEKGMATNSSILAWEIPWTECGGLQSMGSQNQTRLSD